MKIRAQLLIAFVACGVLPIVLLTAFNYIYASRSAQSNLENAEVAIKQNAINQLISIRDIKKQQIEHYFGQIKDQVQTLAEDRMIVDGIRDLSDAFAKFPEELSWNSSELVKSRKRVEQYYSQVFAEEYKKQCGGSVNADALVEQLPDIALAMQTKFIVDNENPLGSKHRLDAAGTSTSYDKVHAELHPILRNYLEKFGYYDIFLIDNSGNIVYTVFKEIDFGTNLVDGNFRKSNLADCVARVAQARDRQAVSFEDLNNYLPSYEAPAGFIAAPVYAGDEQVGVLAFQMPIDRINQLMAVRSGLGETGETYLVGDGWLPRSDSFLDKDHRTVVNSFRQPESARIETAAVKQALSGQAGAEEGANYLGTPVISAYTPIDVLGKQWALLAEVSTEQAFAAVEELRAATASANFSMLFWACGLGLITAAIVAAYAWFSISRLMRPIQETVDTLRDIAEGEGDLTRRLNASRSDELGDLARWFNKFADRIHDLVQIIAVNADAINASSSELQTTADHLHTGATRSKTQSSSVSAAAEEMSINMKSMADSSEGMSRTIHSVASSIEEMNATIREIASNAERSAVVAGEASQIVASSTEKISALGVAAKEIGKVIEVIQDIAEQTNLLALNATIESARAGEVGKGFAVVASEVKTLAKQTAAATDDIRRRIEAIQSSTEDSVQAIAAIRDVIHSVEEVSRTIASAVEEQSITTRQISENFSSTASAADCVARGVSETASASSEINQNISSVDSVLEETVAGAEQSRLAGRRFAELAQQMNSLIGSFKIDRSANHQSLAG